MPPKGGFPRMAGNMTADNGTGHPEEKTGASDGIRTHDIQIHNLAL